MKKLTKEQHKKRHIKLHTAFDELLADYVECHSEEVLFTKMPIIKLMEWSFKQTKNPDEKN